MDPLASSDELPDDGRRFVRASAGVRTLRPAPVPRDSLRRARSASTLAQELEAVRSRNGQREDAAGKDPLLVRAEAAETHAAGLGAALAEARALLADRSARLGAARLAVGALKADLDRLGVVVRDELEAAQARAGAAEATTDELRVALAAERTRRREAEAALADTTAARPAGPTLVSAGPVSEAHPALAVSAAPALAPGDTGSLVKGLSRAAARLRERIAAADALTGAPVATAGSGAVVRAEARPAERTRLPIRAELLDPRAPSGWLRTALPALHAADPAAAEAVFHAGLLAQGLHAPRPLVYDLVLAGHEPLRVALDGAGGALVAPAEGAAGEARFCLRGDVPSLAPLVTGGVPRGLRPLPGVRYAGGWWALRRFLRTLRGPVAPGALGGVGDGVEPLVALALVTAGLPAGAAEQEPLLVGFDLGAEAPPAHLRAGGGEPARSGVGVTRAAQATVHVAPRDLLGFLAGEVPAWGSGDAGALRRLVALLHPVRA